MTVDKAIKAAFERSLPPDPAQYLIVLQTAMAALSADPPELRPPNVEGKPGGLVRLHHGMPTIIVPDLHARRGFLMSLLASIPPLGALDISSRQGKKASVATPTATPTAIPRVTATATNKATPSAKAVMPLNTPGTVFNLLATGKLQVLCLGDGFHAESRARGRWRAAYSEFVGGFREHSTMDQEMCEGLGLMEMVMHAKAAFPGHFHFLKGNHENVLNETGNGNYSFYKFVQEGAMVRSYLDRFYGADFVQVYAAFEKSLPLFAQGQRFLASHAEPVRAFTEDELINAALLPEVIEGLTWTGNEEALPGSVAVMLNRFLPTVHKPRYLTGHRPIPGLFKQRNRGLHLQIHNPDCQVVAWVRADRDLEPEKDIVVVE